MHSTDATRIIFAAFFTSLAFFSSMNSNAMTQAKIPCIKKSSVPVEKRKDLGGTQHVTVDHCDIEIITTVTTRKYEVTKTYCDSDEQTSVTPQSADSPSTKEKNCWQETGVPGEQKFESGHRQKKGDVTTITRTICDHEDKIIVTETTTNKKRRCRKYLDEPVITEIKPKRHHHHRHHHHHDKNKHHKKNTVVSSILGSK